MPPAADAAHTLNVPFAFQGTAHGGDSASRKQLPWNPLETKDFPEETPCEAEVLAGTCI